LLLRPNVTVSLRELTVTATLVVARASIPLKDKLDPELHGVAVGVGVTSVTVTRLFVTFKVQVGTSVEPERVKICKSLTVTVARVPLPDGPEPVAPRGDTGPTDTRPVELLIVHRKPTELAPFA
jgi:hypothetical protein